ncbi:hypothetical protein FRB96_005475 [Tulasnella sp. 330]|nr:hypothetical protein FRB96_005475 [Tulasnella sp. 330]KAG8888307.1 hypothetical protein FRB98_007965 [Tulasnella sp. 332]
MAEILDHAQSEPSDQYQTLEPPEDVNDGDDNHIQWIISNKYYTAPVHFLAKPLSLPPAKPLWPPEEEDEKVPAIIFVFSDGQDYRQRFLSIREGLEAHGAEVTIAVRAQLPGEDGDGEEIEDAETIAEFFSDHSFEFVDVPSSAPSLSEGSESDALDMQGIPRIVSALHTIMWPSLVRKHTKIRSHRLPSLSLSDDDKDHTELSPDHEASALPTEDFDCSFVSFLGSDARKSLFESADGALQDRDLQALEAWLDGDDDQIWRGYPSQLQPSSHPNPKASSSGFEDDFTEFVSAAPHAQPTPATHDPSPPNASSLDLDAEILPSQSEIELTARRIFGGAHSSSSKSVDPDAAADEEEPFDFDLGQVLGALQSMKEEVAEIKDLDARRKAAARIAMGFAAGLGLADEDNE